MQENFENPKPTSQEHAPETEGTSEILQLKPEEKVFLNTIVNSIYRSRSTNEAGSGYLNPNIINSIAEINFKTALRIVRQEERPRIEVLAELATLVKTKPESGVDLENLVASIESSARQRHENTYTHNQDFDYYPANIAQAAVTLRNTDHHTSAALFEIALQAAQELEKNDQSKMYTHSATFLGVLEKYATVDIDAVRTKIENLDLKDGELVTKLKVQELIKAGNLDEAFSVAKKNYKLLLEISSKVALSEPEKLITLLKANFPNAYVKASREFSNNDQDTAIRLLRSVSDDLISSEHSTEGKKLLEEAITLLEYLPPLGIRESMRDSRLNHTRSLLGVISKIDPDRALSILESIGKDEYGATKNEIARNAVFSDTNKAREIYETTQPDSSGKIQTLVEIICSSAMIHGANEHDPLIGELEKCKIQIYHSSDAVTVEHLARISEFYPKKALDLLYKVQYQQDVDTHTEAIFTIIDNNNLSPSESREVLDFIGNKCTFEKERAALDGVLLSQMELKNTQLLSEKGIISYFQSLDPKNENDITAFKNLASTGLIPEHKIEDLLQKGDAQSLNLSSLLLSAEICKKTDFDLVSFDRLAILVQSENESVRQAALHGIKLLQPKIAELFYSSNQQYQEALKKLHRLSQEVQQWFTDLDEYIAENFDTQNLIRLVTKLGQEEALQRFPQAMAKACEEILAHLPSNEDLADYFLENLHLYQAQPWAAKGVEGAIKHFPVAQKFIKAVDASTSPWKDAYWVASVYSKAKLTKPHDEDEWAGGLGAGSQGFSETDPYKNHHWKFTGEQIKTASVLSDVLAGRADEESIKQLGLSVESLKTLKSVEQQLSTAYNNFLSEIESSTTFPEEDKNALLHPENISVRMTDLQNNIRSFVARYLTQIAEGDVGKLNKKIGDISENLEGILQEGLRRFIKIYKVDIPLYDKLYEEFDNLRETGQYPLEVYLGRDGIYAWLGRRAQDVSRRRKLGLEGRKQAKEAGEVIEIQPKYLIYPRYFRDSINYETKREFLEQEGISPDADPMFYDTGYTGTIPEQIMRVMDFENEEIERRIRLLSAPVVHRRIKGIPENARSEIIEYIEHNAKTENTAVGLVKDPESGKIRPIAEPTTPDEQFYFMMVKQAVGRHYWLKEQLHHEPSGNINLDSEHYLIRVRQEYSSLLPPEFISDPKTYLAQQGELLKGSKGEGEYPDEEVILFKLSDDTEIVAKRVELRKAKEARKEFSILIAARKANLPTAEPVGFLSGKTEADSSYLLMKKIEGFSGRKFEKHLRYSGKYNDEQVKSIMQIVAEKNKEMAELFRETLNIDKRWRIKDTIIEFDEETGEVVGVTPIDWERVQSYDPSTPKEIDEIT